MHESYLWNRSPALRDPTVARLEQKLGCKGYAARVRRRWAKRLAGPAVLMLDAAAVALLFALPWGADAGARQRLPGAEPADAAAGAALAAREVPGAAAPDDDDALARK